MAFPALTALPRSVSASFLDQGPVGAPTRLSRYAASVMASVVERTIWRGRSLPLVERTMIHTLLDFTLRASRQENSPQGDFFSSNFACRDHS